MNARDLQTLPADPGVYLFKHGSEVLYIGKAKNLHKRVSSYFRSNQGPRIKVMLRAADNVEFHVVHTESEALLLEDRLIAKHQPKYNVLQKQGETYPYICINSGKNEVSIVHSFQRDGNLYYGPFTGVNIGNVLGYIRDKFDLSDLS